MNWSPPAEAAKQAIPPRTLVEPRRLLVKRDQPAPTIMAGMNGSRHAETFSNPPAIADVRTRCWKPDGGSPCLPVPSQFHSSRGQHRRRGRPTEEPPLTVYPPPVSEDGAGGASARFRRIAEWPRGARRTMPPCFKPGYGRHAGPDVGTFRRCSSCTRGHDDSVRIVAPTLQPGTSYVSQADHDGSKSAAHPHQR